MNLKWRHKKNYVVVLPILHICTVLRHKPVSTASVSFILSCYMRIKTFPLMYDSIEISTKRVVAPSQYD